MWETGDGVRVVRGGGGERGPSDSGRWWLQISEASSDTSGLHITKHRYIIEIEREREYI